MEEDWPVHRVKVLSSTLLSDVLGCIELFEVKGRDESYKQAIIKKEGESKGQSKSQHMIAAQLKKQYPSVVRALSKLEDMGLITKTQIATKGGRAPIIYAWTYKAAILFPEYAPLDSLSGVYFRLFGDWNDCTNYYSNLIICEREEADAMLVFLSWKSRDFLRWVRDEIILSEKETGAENHLSWRFLAIRYLIKESIIYMCEDEDEDKYFDEAFRNISKGDLEKHKDLIMKAFIKVKELAKTLLS